MKWKGTESWKHGITKSHIAIAQSKGQKDITSAAGKATTSQLNPFHNVGLAVKCRYIEQGLLGNKNQIWEEKSLFNDLG